MSHSNICKCTISTLPGTKLSNFQIYTSIYFLEVCFLVDFEDTTRLQLQYIIHLNCNKYTCIVSILIV